MRGESQTLRFWISEMSWTFFHLPFFVESGWICGSFWHFLWQTAQYYLKKPKPLPVFSIEKACFPLTFFLWGKIIRPNATAAFARPSFSTCNYKEKRWILMKPLAASPKFESKKKPPLLFTIRRFPFSTKESFYNSHYFKSDKRKWNGCPTQTKGKDLA